LTTVSRYWERFPWLRTSTTTFILHLSLCDFLYCIVGLPLIVSNIENGHFT
jgi:hypothetical protein